MFYASLFIAVVFFFAGRLLRLFEFRLESIPMGLWLVLSIHFVAMAEYVDAFTKVDKVTYLATYFLLLLGILCGGVAGKFLSPRGKAKLLPAPKGRTTYYVAVAAILFYSVLFIVGYYQSTGTLNPLAGIREMLSGVNHGNEMWSGEGAAMAGADRAQVAAAGGLLVYISRWLLLLPLVFLAMLGSRRILWYAVPFFLLGLLQMTGTYTARTVMGTWCGILFLLINDYVRRFRTWELVSTVSVALFVFLFLHLARMGTVASSDRNIGTVVAENLESAMIDTFEPVGWCFIASQTKRFTPPETIDYFGSYFGALIPRFFWPTKPYYAFEPDLTMAVTGEDISGNNCVRTFTIAAEGFLIGGLPGVFFIAAAYTAFSVMLAAFLAQYHEFVLLRYWFILTSLIAVRCSLVSLVSGGFAVLIFPVIVIALIRRGLCGEALFPWRGKRKKRVTRLTDTTNLSAPLGEIEHPISHGR